MKEKTKSKSETLALIVQAGICTCNIDDYGAWVYHNLDSISHLFAAQVAAAIMQGKPPPPPEDFEKFCKIMHTECLAVVAEQGIGATRH